MNPITWKYCLFGVFFVVFAAACTEEAQRGDVVERGYEGQACRADGGCESGLICVSDLCVRPPDAGDGGTLDAADSDSADTDGADAADAMADSGGDANGADASDAVADTGVDADDVDDTSDGADTADAQPQNPTCTIDAPADGAARQFDEQWTFEATATDPQDGALSGTSVQWESDLAGSLGTGATLQTTLSPSGNHVIECIVTDSDGNSSSSQISVTVESPRAEIFHPNDGETRAEGSPIPFTGRGFDAEDGSLPGSSLVWTSSIDGQIGTGRQFSAPLSAGSNVVTLTVTDSDGNMDSTSITLNVQ
jgi:hypothetical protein